MQDHLEGKGDENITSTDTAMPMMPAQAEAKPAIEKV